MSVLETKDIKARLDVKYLLNRIGEDLTEEGLGDSPEIVEELEQKKKQ